MKNFKFAKASWTNSVFCWNEGTQKGYWIDRLDYFKKFIKNDTNDLSKSCRDLKWVLDKEYRQRHSEIVMNGIGTLISYKEALNYFPKPPKWKNAWNGPIV